MFKTNYPLDANEVKPLDTQMIAGITLIGPIYHYNIYLASRHSLPTVSSINPFSSLNTKFWLNYGFLGVIMTLSLISINIKLLNGRHFNLLDFASFKSILSEMVRSGLMLPCLITFTVWSFNQLYGVDLASVLVGM